jgi:outer membrane lipoprotein carrier protein
VEKYFKLKDTSRKGDLEWVLATSKDKEGEFDRVFFGFNGDELAEMELHDNFGNRTNIVFSHFERNPKLTNASFLFKPPQGTDVVGE